MKVAIEVASQSKTSLAREEVPLQWVLRVRIMELRGDLCPLPRSSSLFDRPYIQSIRGYVVHNPSFMSAHGIAIG